ncbi:hypothetical protein BJX68DRAFT_200622 [Aspergillus pseudodeflectus]|uniref:Uncharacterized protein n=1 Tax=Aspergillus pseudodeflectus TaxID=176178 RepID=A0ABR4JGZ4_9EURO
MGNLIIVINQITRNLCSNPAGTDLLLQTATSQGPPGCVAVPLDESKGKQRGGVLGINDKTACLQVIATILTFCYAGNFHAKEQENVAHELHSSLTGIITWHLTQLADFCFDGSRSCMLDRQNKPLCCRVSNHLVTIWIVASYVVDYLPNNGNRPYSLSQIYIEPKWGVRDIYICAQSLPEKPQSL